MNRERKHNIISPKSEPDVRREAKGCGKKIIKERQYQNVGGTHVS